MKLIPVIFAIVFLFCCRVQAQEKMVAFIGEVNSENVNLRTGPHTSFESFTKLPKGEKLKVLEEKQGWFKVALPDSLALYVHSDFIKEDPLGRPVSSANNLNVRLKADIRSTVVGQLKISERVRIRSKEAEWTKIRPCSECWGWISSEFVEYLKPYVKEAPIAEVEDEQEEKTAAVALKEPITKPVVEEKMDTAEGIIEDSGILFFKPSYPKLVDERGKLLYYLKSDDRKMLDHYSNLKVKVWGEISNSKKPAFFKVKKIAIIP